MRYLLIAALSLFSASSDAYAATIDGLLDAIRSGDRLVIAAQEDGLVTTLDAVEVDEDRANLVMTLISALQNEETGNAELRLSALAVVLCRIAPWTTGTKEQDEQLEQLLYDRFRSARKTKNTDQARFLDCAMNNVEGGYFTFSRQHEELFPTNECEIKVQPSIENFINLHKKGLILRSKISNWNGSYYLLRLDQRLALLEVSQAIVVAHETGVIDASVRDLLRKAGERLESWSNEATLSKTRTGWRLYSDTFVLSHLYLALSEPGKGHLDKLKDAAARWPEALSLEQLKESMEPGVAQSIALEEPEYIDPVHIERLFPGLLVDTQNDECRSWLRQAFDTKHAASVFVTCLDNREPKVVADLEEVDSCITAKLESRDWWLQLGAYRGPEDAQSMITALNEKLLSQAEMHQLDEELFALKSIAPDSDSLFYRIRTAGALSRQDVEVVSKIIHDLLPKQEVLVGRKKQY